MTVRGGWVGGGPGAYDSNLQCEIMDGFEDGGVLSVEDEYWKNGNDFIADEIDREENDDD